MDKASEALFSLKPVTFRYRKEIDPVGTLQFGLIAEDVEKINPDLVVRDEKGQVNSVRYDQVNAMLLNEFLKEHRKVRELEATLAREQNDFQSKLSEQEKQIAALASGLQQSERRARNQQTRSASDIPARRSFTRRREQPLKAKQPGVKNMKNTSPLIKTSTGLPSFRGGFILVILTLASAMLLPEAHAVNPPPDGAYPGFNTAEGQNALLSLDTSTGFANTAVGALSLQSTVDTSFNTGVGAGTLSLNTGNENTAVGAAALLLNTTGEANTAVGVERPFEQ